jgi:hypothetical protein
VAAVWEGVPDLRDLELEEFAFDRLQDESGGWIKDISHEGCRYLSRDEVLRVLRAEIAVEDYERDRYGNASRPARRARGAPEGEK